MGIARDVISRNGTNLAARYCFLVGKAPGQGPKHTGTNVKKNEMERKNKLRVGSDDKSLPYWTTGWLRLKCRETEDPTTHTWAPNFPKNPLQTRLALDFGGAGFVSLKEREYEAAPILSRLKANWRDRSAASLRPPHWPDKRGLFWSHDLEFYLVPIDVT